MSRHDAARRAIERRQAARLGQPETFGWPAPDTARVLDMVRSAEMLLVSADDKLDAASALATDPDTREVVDAARADLAAVIGRLHGRLHRIANPRDGAA